MVNSWFIDCIHFLFAVLTNYHKLRCLKQKLIISQFGKTEIQVRGGSTFLHKVKVTVLEGQSSFLESGDKFTSKFICVVGQVQLHGTEGQMSLFPYWLPARGHHAPRSLSLVVGCHFLYLRASNEQHVKCFLRLESNFFCLSLQKAVCF